MDPLKAKQETLNRYKQAVKESAEDRKKNKALEALKPKVRAKKIKDKLTDLKVVNNKKVILEKHRRREFVIVEDTPRGPKVHRFIGDKFGIL